MRSENQKDVTIIALHIDDLLLAGNNICAINWMKAQIAKWFEMKDIGEQRD